MRHSVLLNLVSEYTVPRYGVLNLVPRNLEQLYLRGRILFVKDKLISGGAAASARQHLFETNNLSYKVLFRIGSCHKVNLKPFWSEFRTIGLSMGIAPVSVVTVLLGMQLQWFCFTGANTRNLSLVSLVYVLVGTKFNRSHSSHECTRTFR